MATDTQKYLSKLFKPGEHICLTGDVWGTGLIALEEALEREPTQFVALNPLHTERNDANVTARRNFLIEFDGLTLEEQHEKLTELKVPYTTLVYSGRKSLHAVIALTEPVNGEEYAELAKLIRLVLWQSDPTQKNPSRLTRVAGATRDGVEQSLVDIRKRVSLDRLLRWLSKFEGHISRSLEREEQVKREREERLRELQEQGAFGIELVHDQTLAFLRGGVGTKGSRHNRLVAAAFELFECGVDYLEALTLIEQAADLHGVTADPKRAKEAEHIVNYVYSGRSKKSP